MTRYAEMFHRLQERRETAFVPFVMLGDPSLEVSRQLIETLLDSGADALELGIPFSDPVADGPTIQAAAVRALRAGVRPVDCWQLLAAVRRRAPAVPIGLLVYANLVIGRGLEDFYGRAGAAGVDSVLVADVPVLEAEPFVEGAIRHGVDPVMIAPPNAVEATLARIAALCRGYTYVVTRPGVTGADQRVQLAHAPLLTRLRELGAPPSLLGFGISTPAHVSAAARAGAAGAISGSAIVAQVPRHLDDVPAMLAAVAALVRALKGATLES
jgi:tryptophan synthase alpha chain